MRRLTYLPPYFVKSCYKKDNVTHSQTLKMGTLQEYRDTIDLQIADAREGHYFMSLELEHVHLNKNFLAYLINNPNNILNAHLKRKSIEKKSFLSEKMIYMEILNVQFEWTHKNRFIFCLSGLDHIEESNRIFKSYDDKWVITRNDIQRAIKCIGEDFYADIKKRIMNGEEIFDENFDIDDLGINVELKEVIYRDRIGRFNNRDFYIDPKFIYSIHKNIPFTKPRTYSHEKEFRLLIDFYTSKGTLTPKVKYLIITAPRTSNIIKK